MKVRITKIPDNNARKWNHADGGSITRDDPPYSVRGKIGNLDNATPRYVIESFFDHPLTTIQLLRERNARRRALQSPPFGGGSFSGAGAGGYWVETTLPAALERMEDEKMKDKIIYSPGPAVETSSRKTFGQIYREHKAAGDKDFWLDGVHYLVKDDPSVKPGAVRYHNVKDYVPTVIREVEDGLGNVLLDSTKASFYSGQQLGKFNRADDPNELANSLNGLPFYNGKNTKAYGGLLKRYDLGGSTADSILYDYFQEQGNPIGDVLLVQPQASVRPAVSQAQPQPFFASPTPILRRVPIEPLGLPSESKEAARVVLTTAPMEGRTSGDLLKAYLNTAAKDVPAVEYTPSENLIQAIMGYESFMDRPYNGLDGIWTIGYGDTDKELNDYYLKHPNERYTREAAERRLRERIGSEFVGYAKKYTPNWDKLTSAQKDSLVSYIYNVGPGAYSKKHPKLMKALREMNMADIAANLDAGWNQKDKKGRPLTGLRKRRRQERQAFLNPQTKYFGESFSYGGLMYQIDAMDSEKKKNVLDLIRKIKEQREL